MANKTIKDNMLTIGTTIFVQGKTDFARVMKPIDGEALVKENERRARIGQMRVDRPFRTISIHDARVIPANAGQKTIEDQYVEERFYERKKMPGVQCFNLDDKSLYAPKFYQRDTNDPTKIKEFTPTAEPDINLSVTLVLNIYDAKKFNRKCIGLESVIFDEPFRAYAGSRDAAAFAQRGLTVVPKTDEEIAAEEANAPAPVQVTEPVAPTPTPATNPLENTPSTMTPSVSPEPMAMNEPNDTSWVCTCGTMNAAASNYCSLCGCPKPATTPMNPYPTAATPNENGGIRYNPNEPNRESY